MACNSVQTKVVSDIMHCAFTIIELAQDYKYRPHLKTIKAMGAMCWQITRALVTLRRMH
jgi:hypothetical protein